MKWLCLLLVSSLCISGCAGLGGNVELLDAIASAGCDLGKVKQHEGTSKDFIVECK